MAVTVTIDLTGILENIFLDQSGKKQKENIQELRALLQDLGVVKGSQEKSVVKKSQPVVGKNPVPPVKKSMKNTVKKKSVVLAKK